MLCNKGASLTVHATVPCPMRCNMCVRPSECWRGVTPEIRIEACKGGWIEDDKTPYNGAAHSGCELMLGAPHTASTETIIS
ncbi:unnamed protein product [Cylicostephanus goldi]|uniref:Uncharacterized protein n=1 Tax=Cylicostephanus goldi TaxID=71465 RepID=A0A3P7QLH8_CYLGO|nr:unnamed protein product [Cylicostephanus goldi]